METEALGQVVDKLAEKIGLAASKLQPLAQQTLEQYQTRQLVNFVGHLMGIVASFVCVYLTWKFTKRYIQEDSFKNVLDREEALWVRLLVFVICVSVSLGCTFAGALPALSNYLAPLPGMLGL